MTSALLTGTLGPLPDGLDGWLQDNLALMDSPAPKHSPGIDVLAQNGAGSDFCWRLLSGSHLAGPAGSTRRARDSDGSEYRATPIRIAPSWFCPETLS